MDDDFEFPTAGNNFDEDMGIPEEEEDTVSPMLKVGEEKEVGKNGLKKKLLKEGEGWETPSKGDEVEGTIQFHSIPFIQPSFLSNQCVP